MATFIINSIADWQTAITDSNSGSPTYSTYKLGTNLTFSSAGQLYASSGGSDSNYLFIGPNDTFDGNSYTITLSPGCEPVSGLSGFLRAQGSVAGQATITNLTVNVGSGITFNTGSGSCVVTTVDASKIPRYITFSNCVFTTSSVQNSSFSVVLLNPGNSGSSATNTQFNNVVVNVNAVAFTPDSSQTAFALYNYLDGNSSLTNVIIKIVKLSGAYGGVCGFLDNGVSAGSPNTLTVNSMYVIVSDATGMTGGNGTAIFWNQNNNTVTTYTNIYTVFGSYSSTNANGGLLGANVYGGSTANVTNYYTNYTNANFTVNNSGGTINTFNTNNNFTWSTTPSFAATSGPPPAPAGNFNTSTTPYRISSFLSSPFNASVYTTYDASPALGASSPGAPCLCKGMLIETVDGPRAVEKLCEGDLVFTPDLRVVPVVRIIVTEMFGTPENVPCKIPAHFFTKHYPTKDLLISPHHMIFYDGQWRLPVWLNVSRETKLIGRPFTYYHVQLPDYENDKLICHNLPIDSFEGKTQDDNEFVWD